MKKEYVILAVVSAIVLLLGTSFGFFVFKKTGGNNLITTGELYLDLVEGTDSITLEDVFPMSSTKARRDIANNTMTFNIRGINSSDDTIKYNVIVSKGEDIDGKNRFADFDLRFDLIRVVNGEDIYVVRNKSFQILDDSVLYTRSLLKEDGEINEQYKLRVWLSGDVTISDSTTGDSVYSTTDFANSYANVQLKVTGSDNKSTNNLKKNNMSTLPSFVESNKANVKEIYFDALTNELQESYDNAAEANKATVTYQDTGEVMFWFTDATLSEGEEAPKYVLHVVSDGITYLTTGSSLFNNYENVEVIEFNNVNTSKVTDMSWMFQFCKKLENLDLSMFDTKNVTTMYSMFFDCESLVSLDISSFDTSKVTTMYQMFMYCKALQFIDLSNICTSNVVNMHSMFHGDEALICLDLASFDTHKVTDFEKMFFNCKEILNINFDGWDTSNANTMQEMFSWLLKIKELDLRTFDTSSLTIFKDMFRGLGMIEKIYVTYNWNTSSVTVDGEDLMFQYDANLVGGNGTTFDSTNVTSSYARIDNPLTEPGYLTYKELL